MLSEKELDICASILARGAENTLKKYHKGIINLTSETYRHEDFSKSEIEELIRKLITTSPDISAYVYLLRKVSSRRISDCIFEKGLSYEGVAAELTNEKTGEKGVDASIVSKMAKHTGLDHQGKRSRELADLFGVNERWILGYADIDKFEGVK